MHSDYSENIAITPSDQKWAQASQKLAGHTAGTDAQECILDEVSTGEASWSTSFLKLPAGATLHLSQTQHHELMVLQGELHTDQCSYPRHSYLRFGANPSTDQSLTLHTRDSDTLVFCKIQHQKTSDHKDLHNDTAQSPWLQGSVPGLEVMPLHSHGHVNIALVRWAPDTQFHPHVHPGGEEIIVLEGTFHDETGSYPTGTWLRNAPYSKHTPYTQEDGALIYVKTGHLPISH